MGKDKGKGKGHEYGLRQEAYQLKRTRFNKIINDLAGKKAFFMSFVRFPAQLNTADGIKNLLFDLKTVLESSEYTEITENSKQKTKQAFELKRSRDESRRNFKRGRRDYCNSIDSWYSREYANVNLATAVKKQRKPTVTASERALQCC